ncbi:hypothetical protein CHS0354_016279 [Potamilus streckersoni]|uniref:Uncharacterized protein n=1 Tax=Potamilus streckersoni TaxID=2493646 RepID=A0AAE0VLM5_9BIVA|nr:hypothetical protein CHS0354_016279 [Potamilus streckersoni]
MMIRYVVIIALFGIAEIVTGGNCPNLNSISSCGDIRFCPYPDSADWKCLKSAMNCDENNGIYYHCSRDVNGCYVHHCAKRVYCYPGQQPVLDLTKDTAMCQTCPEEEYQISPFWSNEQLDCDYAKTKCDGEGEIECHPGTPTEDRTCRCDIQKNLALQGYAYNKRTCCSKYYDQECYCISFKDQCPPGKVRYFNYICLPECPQGFYRQLDSEECISQNSSSPKNATSTVQTPHQDSQVPTGIIIGLAVITVLLASIAALALIYCLKHRQQRRPKAGGIEAPHIFCNGDSNNLRDSNEAPETVKFLEEKDSVATKDRKKNKDAGNGHITEYNINASGAIINIGGENNTRFKYIKNFTQDTPESLHGSERASSITPEENLVSVNPEESRQEESILSNETSMDTELKKPVEHEDVHPDQTPVEAIDQTKRKEVWSSLDMVPDDQTKRKDVWSQPEIVLDDQTKRKEVWSSLDMVPDDQTKRKDVWSQPEIVLDDQTKGKEVWSPLDMVPDDQTNRKEVWSPSVVADYQTKKEPENSVSN